MSEVKKDFDLQHPHWENYWDTFSAEGGLAVDEAPSVAAKQAADEFKKRGIVNILELGGGSGRDTLFFAKEGFQLHVVEYTEKGVEIIRRKAAEAGVANSVKVVQHDVRKPLPFESGSFEGCFSHMLYCMAFTEKELRGINQEIRRVLMSGGSNIYTARNLNDPMYGAGTHKGGNVYEVNGFIIHFFDKKIIEDLSEGYEIQQISELEEGSLPKRLYSVIQQVK
ncbi:class I SAM-dependent methyltransferase [Evansella clarkii]|uniref:class I SAM-dependent methyltransferase n=1 Tax=Evansella clarkii TaxID=79879 RepID=UPI000997B922|nr:class I SAM-dependent methyltransferase [Evansella clarkii]